MGDHLHRYMTDESRDLERSNSWSQYA